MQNYHEMERRFPIALVGASVSNASPIPTLIPIMACLRQDDQPHRIIPQQAFVRTTWLTLMLTARSRQPTYSLGHRISAALALVCYLATATGFPLPSFTTRQPGQTFPCQNHSCGCVTAEQCWTNCCC